MSPRRLLVAALAAVTLAAPAAAAGAPAQAPPPARVKAERLASIWGRCPTAHDANRLLAIARRPARRPVRTRRAGAALRAYRVVVVQCSKPVPMPTVIVPPTDGPVLPPAES